MKTLILSYSDIVGGAARCAYRLHEGLLKIDIESQMLVQVKSSPDPNVIGLPVTSGIGQGISGLRLILEGLPLKLFGNNYRGIYSSNWIPDQVNSKIKKINPDIINLHWINAGFLQIETIRKFNKPIVWTIHDMWAFTGGCHYSGKCDRYQVSCGACPELQSYRDSDFSRWIWQRKAKTLKNLNLTIIAPSLWLQKCAQSSSLFKDFRIEVIPTAVNHEIYRPIDRQTARKLLNLPQEKHLVLFGALNAIGDSRKGFHLLQPALQELSGTEWRENLELVIFGASKPENPPELGFPVHYLGTLNDDLSLALAYSAADVFVIPSVQDNLPNTIMESLSCGTPSVGFSIGGIPDMIEHQKNGYLAQPYSVEDLAQGIIWVIENKERYQKLSDYARQKVETQFTLKTQAIKYSSMFEELLVTQ